MVFAQFPVPLRDVLCFLQDDLSFYQYQMFMCILTLQEDPSLPFASGAQNNAYRSETFAYADSAVQAS